MRTEHRKEGEERQVGSTGHKQCTVARSKEIAYGEFKSDISAVLETFGGSNSGESGKQVASAMKTRSSSNARFNDKAMDIAWTVEPMSRRESVERFY